MSLESLFSDLSDKRSKTHQVYSFESLLFMSMCAIMAGEDSFTGIADYAETNRNYFDKYFDLPLYTPTHDTFNRLFDTLDPSEFDKWFVSYTRNIAAYCESRDLKNESIKHQAIDGKTIRNSGKDKPFHVVSAWCSRNRLVLCQAKVDEKTNEIKAIPILLEMMDLESTVTTIDAMGCQRDICQLIQYKKGDYIIALKENQPKLYVDVKDYFNQIQEFSHAKFEHNDKGHGRVEKRICTVTDDIEWLKEDHKWAGLQTIVRVENEVETKGKVTSFTRYFISSLCSNAAQHLDIIRKHWGVENNLHWCLDCTFNEDEACVRRENAALNLNTARKIALNVLSSLKSEKSSLRSMQRKCWNPTNAATFLNLITNDSQLTSGGVQA
jgi:predicted transposase YbfD/YdcC